MHGGEDAGGLAAFAAQLPLAHMFTLILPDVPGHGQFPAQGEGGLDVTRDAPLLQTCLMEVPIWLVIPTAGLLPC